MSANIEGRPSPTEKILVPPDRIPEWIPGVETLDSSTLNWKGIVLRGYQYPCQAAAIPPMRDYMIVAYGGAPTSMRRAVGRESDEAIVGRGRISLLTRAERSTWTWRDPIEVRHIYLCHDEIVSVAANVFDRDPQSIEIADRISAHDPLILNCFDTLEAELKNGGFGQRMMIDALRSQLSVHLLRNYANIHLTDDIGAALTRTQKRLVIDLIESRLGENISLDELATAVKMSPFHFSRRFKAVFGISPYAYVIRARVTKAQEMLCHRRAPLKVIALECGFSDQSHFCNTFKRVVGMSPTFYQSCSIYP